MFPKRHLSSQAKRTAMINTLSSLRQQWEEAAEEQSLIHVQASIGLVLADIVFAMGFSRDEEDYILGERLRYEALFTQDEQIRLSPEEDMVPFVEEPISHPMINALDLEAVIPGKNGNQ